MMKTSQPCHVTPGYILPLNITDDFGNDAINITEFQAEIISQNSKIQLDSAYRFVTDNTVVLDGDPDSHGELFLTNIRNHKKFMVKVQLMSCAPGYVTSNDSHTKCVCSSTVGNAQYQDVYECDDNNNVAMIAPGVWIGYVGEEKGNENSLYTGSCFHGYCNDFNHNSGTSRLFQLNSTASKNELEQLICAENRTGILCGACIPNHSVFYHSSTFACGSNELCSYGFIFYVLSELLPTTILFLLILFYNVNLTSGYAYSVIFMLQTLNSIGVLIDSESGNSWITPINIAMMFYDTLNLDFFTYKLSFCLWKGASTLDMLVMQYVTMLFALGLIGSTVLLVNYCNCAKISRRLCRNKRVHRCQTSFVNGLAAFLVICYSKCALTSFYILDSAHIYGKGSVVYNHTLVHLTGTDFFHPKHLRYAIPAIIVLATIVIPLSIILFGDSFFLKLEYLFNRYCFSQRNLYPWTRFRQKFKPLFDSFQGCFKDEYRFVSGLFFFYRIVFLLVLVVSPNSDIFYGLQQILFIFIFTVRPSYSLSKKISTI